jgi:hypothetical protein
LKTVGWARRASGVFALGTVPIEAARLVAATGVDLERMLGCS